MISLLSHLHDCTRKSSKSPSGNIPIACTADDRRYTGPGSFRSTSSGLNFMRGASPASGVRRNSAP
jgi:hypothetical protein